VNRAPNGNAQKVLEAFQGRLGSVRHPELIQATGLQRTQVTEACCVLVGRGLVLRLWRGTFRLTAAGVQALSEGKAITSGPPSGRSAMRNTFRARLWKALRLRGNSDLRGLLVLAARVGDSPKEARNYLNALCKALYVARHGNPRDPIYCLRVDSGAQAPQWNKRAGTLRDPNLGETYELA